MSKLEVVLLAADARLPEKAHNGDLGYDLFALEDVVVQSNDVVKVKTGIACNFPEGYGALIRDRSSVATKKKLFVVAGVIDQEYTGEIVVALYNPSYSTTINKGDKIAQMILTPVVTFPVVEVDSVNETSRGTGGFGSTGQ